jgi:NAD(P)-dependent dehydrogenase (short-subunit alcohol dehydrogenase family)
MTAKDLDSHYAVNLRAVTMLSLEFIRGFAPGGAGRIINLTSGQGLAPMPHELAYAATKGAIDALTLSLSAAVARLGITVNAIDPGPTDTGWMQEELRESLLNAAPTGRLGTPGCRSAGRVLGRGGRRVGDWAGDSVARRPFAAFRTCAKSDSVSLSTQRRTQRSSRTLDARSR